MGKKYYRKSRFELPKDGYLGALLRMLPVVIMLGIVPLIVREYKHEYGLAEYPWSSSQPYSYEFFLASKSLVLTLLTFLMAGCVVVRLWKEKRKAAFAKVLIPLFAYGVLAFLSACFSVNTSFSFSGGPEHFESVWALLSYVLVVYYVFLYAQDDLELQVAADGLCFSASIIGIIGTFQGLGMDLFAAGWYQKLITSDEFLAMCGGKLQLNFANNTAYATLYNPNYLGVYGSFMVPFLVMMFLHEKNKWRRLWHGGNFILVTIALLSSHSRAGLVAAIAALCVALLFTFRKLLKWWYLAIPAINFAVVLVLLVNAYNDDLIFNRLKNLIKPDNVEVAEEIAEDGTVVRISGLTEMYTEKDGVVFTYNDVYAKVALGIVENGYGMYALDESGEQQIELLPNDDGTEYSFTHPALADIKIYPGYIGEKFGMCIKAAGEWNFVCDEKGQNYQYITGFGKESDMIMADSFGFENYQRAFSGRGYIWSRTLPLLKEHIFLGSGPDTFVLEFPQEDYLKMKQNGYQNVIMTKPHSLYLQVGVQTGVLSLLCMLVFFGWYVVWGLKLYAFRKLSTQTEAFGIAAFIGSLGYMITGISNDSMVATAPVFWGMVAIGLAANAMVTKQRKQELSATEKK